MLCPPLELPWLPHATAAYTGMILFLPYAGSAASAELLSTKAELLGRYDLKYLIAVPHCLTACLSPVGVPRCDVGMCEAPETGVWDEGACAVLLIVTGGACSFSRQGIIFSLGIHPSKLFNVRVNC